MRLVCLALALSYGVASAGAQSPKFKFQEKGAVDAKLPYYPILVSVAPEKPVVVKKEPAYLGTPKYGFLTAGNGPKSKTVFVLDEPEGSDWKIYIDKNQNGDLTDDGDGAWNKKTDNRGRILYGVMDVTIHASYGTEKKESAKGLSTLGLYRFADAPGLLTYRQSAYAGEVKLDKVHKAILVENDADGLFNKSVKTAEEAAKSRPVWLLIDSADDGSYKTRIDIRAPFKYEEKTYEATVSADGGTVQVKPSTKVALDLTPKAPERPPLLKAGVAAPDFVAEKWGGGDLKLSDYRGKIVILDFWATWCGPCQASMPHVEKVFQSVKDQDVVVLGVCVWDAKEEYTKWIPENQSKYTFQFAFDPAGRDSAKSIAGKLFQVSGIPTTYIIDKDGKVAEAIVGYSEGDKRVEEALKKLGVKID